MGACLGTVSQETGVAENQSQAEIMEAWKLNYSSSVRGTLVKRKTSDIDDDYCILYEQFLGKGGCGVVHIGENLANDQLYAIKICNKADNDLSRLEREILLLKDVDHCNIVRLFSVYDSSERIHLVMELCSGGHLGTLIQSREKFNYNQGRHLDEEWAKSLCRQLMSAVRHIHERGIAHRDIKLQNILIEKGASRDSQIKLIDFGYGSRFIGCCPMKTHCGTPYTTAPEVYRKSYDERCDVWSVGVVLFIMLCGKRPFQKVDIPGDLKDAGKAAMTTNILAGRYTFNPRYWGHVSSDAQTYVRTLLHPNYLKRVHAAAAMEIPWLKDRSDKNPAAVELSIVLASYAGSDKDTSIGSKSNRLGSNVGKLLMGGSDMNLFNSSKFMDKNSSSNFNSESGKDMGNSSMKGLPSTSIKEDPGGSEYLTADINQDPQVIGAVVNILKNSGGVVSSSGIINNISTAPLRRTGNMALAFSLQADEKTAKMRDFFQQIDTDSSGSLSRQEFQDGMELIMTGQKLSHTDCGIIFDTVDVNKDDQITFTEFLAATLDPEVLDIDALSQAFSVLDGNGDGYISMEELKRMYNFKFMKKKWTKDETTVPVVPVPVVPVPVPASVPVPVPVPAPVPAFTTTSNSDTTGRTLGKPSPLDIRENSTAFKESLEALYEPNKGVSETKTSTEKENDKEREKAKENNKENEGSSNVNTEPEIESKEKELRDALDRIGNIGVVGAGRDNESLEDFLMSVMTCCDTDNDGRISFDEFIFAMTGMHSTPLTTYRGSGPSTARNSRNNSTSNSANNSIMVISGQSNNHSRAGSNTGSNAGSYPNSNTSSNAASRAGSRVGSRAVSRASSPSLQDRSSFKAQQHNDAIMNNNKINNSHRYNKVAVDSGDVRTCQDELDENVDPAFVFQDGILETASATAAGAAAKMKKRLLDMAENITLSASASRDCSGALDESKFSSIYAKPVPLGGGTDNSHADSSATLLDGK